MRITLANRESANKVFFAMTTSETVRSEAQANDGRSPKNGAAGEATANPEPLWDANDVARYLKSSRSWVYHRAEAGELPCLRIGGLLRFEPEAVRAYARKKASGAAW
jgi:excisionase family DNA binding protein